MKNVYLDNAATTPLAPEVWEAMEPFLKEHFGNPSSTHSYGRKTKNALEVSRKKIGQLINADPGEIIFTAGGTEADNMALHCAINNLGVERIISSKIEHHAVLHFVESVADNIEVAFVNINSDGSVDMEHLKELIKKSNKKTIVSLMHANNEIGTLLPLKEIADLCKSNNALFHCDTVQTMGHYHFDFKSLDLDFATCAAHKFHGPKGTGFLYVNKKNAVDSMIKGGSQERGHRAGTENVYGIVGLAQAMELCYTNLDEHITYVQSLKAKMIDGLRKINPEIEINGAKEAKNSLYTVLNVSFPPNPKNSMLLFSLDLEGVAVSGGSACASGSNQGSHVITALGKNPDCTAVRFSFSRYNTPEEIEYTLEKIEKILYG